MCASVCVRAAHLGAGVGLREHLVDGAAHVLLHLDQAAVLHRRRPFAACVTAALKKKVTKRTTTTWKSKRTSYGTGTGTGKGKGKGKGKSTSYGTGKGMS